MDAKIAFDMLDSGKKGSLNRTEALAWIRSRGCVLSDTDIERFVLSRLRMNPKFARIDESEMKYTYYDLVKVTDSIKANNGLVSFGPDTVALEDCLARISKGDSISMLELKETLMKDGDYKMSEKEFDTFISQIGLPLSTAFVSPGQLANQIVQAMQP